MLKKLLFFLCTLLSTGLNGQVIYDCNNIPEILRNRANAVIRNMETIVDMRSPENVIINVHKAITVLNKNGDSKAELSIGYDKNTIIRSIKGFVYDASGKQILKFNQSHFTDESAIQNFSLFEDNRVKFYGPNVNDYPYTVVYEYEIRNKQNLIIPDWYAVPYAQVSVEKSSYQFICKPEDKLRIKAYNLPNKALETKSEKAVYYSWETAQVPALQDEPYSPSSDSYLSYVKIAPEQFVYYNASGHYNNWNELGKWYYTELVKNRQILLPETVQMIRDLTAPYQTPQEKARKIYEYVQQKTRYISVQIGIGGFQPIAAGEVDRLGYGDCKALVNYTQSLLKAINIDSYYCLVYAGSQKRSLDHDFASMNQANHAILCLPFEKDTTWLECTSQTTPYGFLGDFTDDRIVLACTPEGGKLLHTPILKAEENKTIRISDLLIDQEGNVQGKMETSFSGGAYDDCEYLISQSQEDQVKSLKMKYDLDNIEFNKIKFEQFKKGSPLTKETLDLKVRSYVPLTSSRGYLILNAFNKKGITSEVSHRKRPLYLNRGYVNEDVINYTLPEAFKLESKPDDIYLKTDFGIYTVKTVISGQKLTYSRKLVMNSGTFAPERYKDFVDFLFKINRSDFSKAVFMIK